MKGGCGWLAAIGCFGLAMLAALLVSLPTILPEQAGQPVNVGPATPMPRANRSTITVQTARGEKVDQPAWKIGLWGATIFVVLYVTAQVKNSGRHQATADLAWGSRWWPWSSWCS